MTQLRNLSETSFAPYGQIIAPQGQEPFQIILSESGAGGWRIAVSVLKRQSVVRLGLHPDSRESFEPLSGICVLWVAEKDSPDRIEAFLLDQPICLYKNVWHAAMALSEAATLKIMENDIVNGQEYILPQPLNMGTIICHE